MKINNQIHITLQILFIGVLLLPSCKSRQQKIRERLTIYDSLICTNPISAYDSLKKYQGTKPDKKNEAYYNLLYTIAEHKTDKWPKSDSMIKASYNWYKNSDSEGEKYNFARATMYYAIVKYSIDNKDTMPYHLFKKALILFNNCKVIDYNSMGIVNQGIGDIHYGNNQYEKSLEYFNTACALFEKAGKYENYICTKIELLSALYSLRRTNEVIMTLDLLNEYQKDSSYIKSYINQSLSTFYSARHRYKEALLYRKKAMQFGGERYKVDNLWATALYSSKLHLYNDAKRYAFQLDSVLSKGNDADAYKYYNALSSHYDIMEDVDMSLKYKRKAYKMLDSLYLMEIETSFSRYEHLYGSLQKELNYGNDKLRHKNSIFICVIILIVVLYTIIIMLGIREKRKYLRQQIIYKSIINAFSMANVSLLSNVGQMGIVDTEEREKAQQYIDSHKKKIRKDIFNLIPKQYSMNDKLSNNEKIVKYLSSLNFTQKEIADIIISDKSNITTRIIRIKNKHNL